MPDKRVRVDAPGEDGKDTPTLSDAIAIIEKAAERAIEANDPDLAVLERALESLTEKVCCAKQTVDKAAKWAQYLDRLDESDDSEAYKAVLRTGKVTSAEFERMDYHVQSSITVQFELKDKSKGSISISYNGDNEGSGYLFGRFYGGGVDLQLFEEADNLEPEVDRKEDLQALADVFGLSSEDAQKVIRSVNDV
mmetsp:Transcript_131036/g.184726  ORF Transcript_131036/g.184726 Transcript_131036/m.184726 type:complete len:194 (-) Transcript_131036:87-668(-)